MTNTAKNCADTNEGMHKKTDLKNMTVYVNDYRTDNQCFLQHEAGDRKIKGEVERKTMILKKRESSENHERRNENPRLQHKRRFINRNVFAITGWDKERRINGFRWACTRKTSEKKNIRAVQ